MNAVLDELIELATNLQRAGMGPAQAAAVAHLVVSHGMTVTDASAVPDPFAHHRQTAHTDHHHTNTGGSPVA